MAAIPRAIPLTGPGPFTNGLGEPACQVRAAAGPPRSGKELRLKLIIVESPAKARTIEKFLGSGYKVAASYGHVRDLPSSAKEIPEEVRQEPWARLGVDTVDGFRPLYVITPESKAFRSLKAERTR